MWRRAYGGKYAHYWISTGRYKAEETKTACGKVGMVPRIHDWPSFGVPFCEKCEKAIATAASSAANRS